MLFVLTPLKAKATLKNSLFYTGAKPTELKITSVLFLLYAPSLFYIIRNTHYGTVHR